ncbi:SGNH/GDSL hydrolase family protein [Rossellomorea sp. NS-SX7]|uniref:SGNH/GDSL hydrolase family protein n=1 Tax=Rossellomorea sp. NS-SX7 TaxID=3463856 RepID=UPI00405909DB
MKNFMIVFLFIITVSALAGGKLHWEQKISAVQADTIHVDMPKQVVKADSTDKEEEAKKERMLKLDRMNYLPPELQQKFREKINQDQQLHLMIIGSSSTSEQKDAWPELLEEKLVEVYGDSLLNVTIKEIANKTSDKVLEEDIHKKLTEQKPDILLLEPFLLYDNGELGMTDRLKNLSVLLKDFKKESPDMTIILQPSNPIYGAHYYLQDEKELEDYAKENKYIYLDHWQAWPDSGKKEMKDYLTTENLPNKKGNEVWAKYLADYFVRDIKD